MSRRAVIYVCAVSVLLVIVIAGNMTYWFGLNKPVTNAGPAQTLCEEAVYARIYSTRPKPPSTMTTSDATECSKTTTPL